MKKLFLLFAIALFSNLAISQISTPAVGPTPALGQWLGGTTSTLNIYRSGNVGIGTHLFIDGGDTYKLSVNGRIRATAVKVYTDWADYVFDADYNLPSLQEVEQHIITNGHLKDIPSAKTVEEKGIELGEMNKLLLQKIEELTLYVIALNKEIENLKN